MPNEAETSWYSKLYLVNEQAPGLGRCLVQFSEDVEVVIFKDTGTRTVRYRYDLANFGLSPVLSRTHTFWTEDPEEGIEITCTRNASVDLPHKYVGASGNWRTVEVVFSEPLRTAERIQYEVSLQTSSTFFHAESFEILSQQLTNSMSLTVVAPAEFGIAEHAVAIESADGFRRDDRPQTWITQDDGLQRLNWRVQSPRMHDVYRTSWSLTETGALSSDLRG